MTFAEALLIETAAADRAAKLIKTTALNLYHQGHTVEATDLHNCAERLELIRPNLVEAYREFTKPVHNLDMRGI